MLKAGPIPTPQNVLKLYQTPPFAILVMVRLF